MALADYTALRAAQASPQQPIDIAKRIAITNPSGSMWGSSWRGTGVPAQGAIPGAGAICDRTTLGAVGQLNPTTELRALWQSINHSNSSIPSGMLCVQLIDRLAHMGGLDGTVTTAQTVSTPALTRSTSGKGVHAAIEVYTAVGATPASATISYTNSAGTSGQISPAVLAFNGGGDIGASKFRPLSVAAGDDGVQAVASLTLSASTGTAGSFGVTLYKPLSPIIVVTCAGLGGAGDPVLDLGGYASLIPTDACVQWIFTCWTNSNTDIAGNLSMFED